MDFDEKSAIFVQKNKDEECASRRNPTNLYKSYKFWFVNMDLIAEHNKKYNFFCEMYTSIQKIS